MGVYPSILKIFATPLFSWLLPSNKDITGLGKVMGYVFIFHFMAMMMLDG